MGYFQSDCKKKEEGNSYKKNKSTRITNVGKTEASFGLKSKYINIFFKFILH